MRSILTLILLVPAFQAIVLAQEKNTCASFEQTIKSTYNFKPSRLTDSERESKSAAMDRFWNLVKGDPKRLVPCLRIALQDTTADKWFRFDASTLLVELDPSPISKAIQVRNYAEADLGDVDLRTWVTVLAARGFEGHDVSEAGSRWLAYPQARYFLPEHAGHEVSAFQGALFIFGSMDEVQATPALIKILTQRQHPGREHALLILLSQATAESLRALKQIDTGTLTPESRGKLQTLLQSPDLLKPRANPKTGREEFIRAFEETLNGDSSRFMGLVESVPDGEKDVVAVLKPQDLPLVRKLRRMMISGGNPHSIEYYETFTDILMAIVWKPELVK